MKDSTMEIFGASSGALATDGSYGVAPSGYRIPATIRLGEVRLRVANLDTSLAFYTTVLGMRVLRREATHAWLGAHDRDRVLVELNEFAGAKLLGRSARLGLYHFAILLPDRPALGRFVKHLGDIGARAGAGDHLVSEAFYLNDPDGLGIEVYADRPRDTWRRMDRQLMMASDAVDVDDLVRSAGPTTWTGMPANTIMGHVHLHVGDIDRAAAFYADVLGFDKVMWSSPGALFLSAGGYHHHLGTNVWAGVGAPSTQPDEAGLIEWTIEMPDADSILAATSNIVAAGQAFERDGDEIVTNDPWGTSVRLRTFAL